MEKHICKLCSRSFSNGRALGGHMRSHVTPLPPSTQPGKAQLEQNESASSSSSEGEEEEEEDDEGKSLCYGLRENPKKSFRLVDPEFSFAVDAGSVVQDRESETESSRIPVRHRRSKRQRRSAEPKSIREQEPDLEPEPLSSVSDTTPEEDVALCLMMLSRDVWMRDSIVDEYEEENEEEEKEEEEEEEADEEEESPEELKFRPKRRGKYQCGTCKKVFRSYQALGGHRASHKKIKGCSALPSPPQEAISTAENVGHTDHRRIHKCPVCFRVFRSGQALGGHKRSHLTAPVASTAAVAAPAKFYDSLIDLNLPAPIEDDDISQVEMSAVSDAEFVDLATK